MRTTTAAHPRFFLLPYGAALAVALGSIANTSSAQIYVANRNLASVSEFSLSGALINPALVTGAQSGGLDYAVAVAGNNLFFSSDTDPTPNLGEFNATTGATLIPSMVASSTMKGIRGLAVSGNKLYAASDFTTLADSTTTTSIGVFNAITGALETNSLVTGLNDPTSIAVAGNRLYELNYNP
jgi:hypothetical protein